MSKAFEYLSVELRVDDEPPPEDVAVLNDRLHRHNAAIIGCDNGRCLTIFVRDEAREIVAGLHGCTAGRGDRPASYRRFGCATILRGRGLGARLLATAEVEAARRGCREIASGHS